MSYLSGPEIRRLVNLGEVEIEPFTDNQVGPNSYDMRLHPELRVYNDLILDMRKDNPTRPMTIPEEGLVLVPGELYLGRTVERTSTPLHVPEVVGRSSVGRLGIFIHVTAGFGDHGFNGTWTLEITCIRRVRIYPFARICQLSLAPLVGEPFPYKGRYQHQVDATASRFHQPRKTS